MMVATMTKPSTTMTQAGASEEEGRDGEHCGDHPDDDDRARARRGCPGGPARARPG